MKILELYYEPILSGQTAHVLPLSKGLVSRGHEVTVVLPTCLNAISREYQNAGVKVRLLEMQKLLWPIKSIIAYLNLLHREKFEIVHIHSQEAGIIARFLSWLQGVKNIFYTPQTIDIRQNHWYFMYVFMEKTLALITHQIFSVNYPDAQRMIKWGIPADKVSVVPNGIELSQFTNMEVRENICKRLGINPKFPIIMQIARITPQKNPLMFIIGAKYVLAECPNAQFVWIGEGPLFLDIKSKVESLNLQDNIYFLGRIDQAYRYLTAADVVTLTSRWEGLPFSILEAMACSKPVVVTAVNGCQDLVIHNKSGYLVKLDDVSNWAKSILQLLANPQLAQFMGSTARRIVEEKYSISTMITRIEQAYSSSPRLIV